MPKLIRKSCGWTRTLWGVRFQGGKQTFLVGESWHKPRPAAYPGEPMRTLVFKSRQQAKAWCDSKRKEFKRKFYAADWRITPVRVREITGTTNCT